jgi:hypothetical protein
VKEPLRPEAANPERSHVRSFCERVVSGGVPVWVECCPLAGQPTNECFAIVEQQVAAHGGQQLTGWAVWELPGVFIEAEFHAVWQPPNGPLRCITPRGPGFARILFVADPTRKYTGRQVDNTRQALVRDHEVNLLLHLCTRRFEIFNQGDLAHEHGAVALKKKAHRELLKLEKNMANLQRRLVRRYGPAYPHG